LQFGEHFEVLGELAGLRFGPSQTAHREGSLCAEQITSLGKLHTSGTS
jgi:hypothetical protein